MGFGRRIAAVAVCAAFLQLPIAWACGASLELGEGMPYVYCAPSTTGESGVCGDGYEEDRLGEELVLALLRSAVGG